MKTPYFNIKATGKSPTDLLPAPQPGIFSGGRSISFFSLYELESSSYEILSRVEYELTLKMQNEIKLDHRKIASYITIYIICESPIRPFSTSLSRKSTFLQIKKKHTEFNRSQCRSTIAHSCVSIRTLLKNSRAQRCVAARVHVYHATNPMPIAQCQRRALACSDMISTDQKQMILAHRVLSGTRPTYL